MRKLFSTRRRVITIASATVVALAGGGAAFAYFTATGAGTGQASVGTAGSFTVTQTTPTPTALLPGGSDTVTFSIHNGTSGALEFASAAASINSSAGNITASGTAVSGCLATWFGATVATDPGAGTDIPAGTSVTATVTVTMTDTPTVSQDSCELAAGPDVTLTLS